MATLKITAAQGSGNITSFNLVDSDGAPVDLTAKGATVVSVRLDGGRYACSGVAIDSSTDDVTFSGDMVYIKFGRLQAQPQAQAYFPKISYITAASDEPEVLAGQGYETQVQLTVVA